jgi:mRNA-degrading endonuclease RelE of RelBE toxin-antitoxin system
MHVDLHYHAEEDLRRLQGTDPRAAAAVLVTLQQIEADPRASDKLTTHGDNQVGAVRIGVKGWQAPRGNLWRFRVFDTPATVYRVVYGYHWQTRQVCVLAVVHKDEFDYELDSDIAKRILADWHAI